MHEHQRNYIFLTTKMILMIHFCQFYTILKNAIFDQINFIFVVKIWDQKNISNKVNVEEKKWNHVCSNVNI